MAFTLSVIESAWRRARDKCECKRSTHQHSYGRCNKQLVWANRGKEGSRGCWEAHHKTAGAPDTLSNCEILCCDCHKKTRSYGG